MKLCMYYSTRLRHPNRTINPSDLQALVYKYRTMPLSLHVAMYIRNYMFVSVMQWVLMSRTHLHQVMTMISALTIRYVQYLRIIMF